MRFACLKNDDPRVKKSPECQQVAYRAVLAVLLMMVGGLCLLTVHSSDDYWYSTFLNDGIGVYLTRMIEHYRTFNGRVWVHVLAHILLYAGNWLFALVCCGACLAMPLLIGCASGLSRENRWMATALFAIGFSAMPTTFFVEGVLWISACCNYLIPTMVLCVLVWQMERGSAMPWFLLTAFLCGSATEQMGMMALALLALYGITNPQKRGTRLAGWLAALMGLATVFASPATGTRAAGEIPMDSLSAIVSRVSESFCNVAYIMTGEITILVLLGILMVLSGWFLGEHNRLAIWMGYIVGAWTLGLWFLPVELQVIGCAAVLVILAFFALWMLLRGHRLPGSMILTALASVGVMLPTVSVGCRNLLPFYLLILLSACILALKMIPARRKPVLVYAALGLFVATLLGMIPLAEGVLYNYRLDHKNRQSAKQTAELGTVYYDAGYDMRHTFIKAFASPYFQGKYLESVGMQADMDFELLCAGNPPPQIICGETRLDETAIRSVGGVDLLPLRAVVETMGGTVTWTKELMEVELDGVRCRLLSLGDLKMRAVWSDGNGILRRMNLTRLQVYAKGYVEVSLLTEVFGLEVVWDADGQTCTVRKG